MGRRERIVGRNLDGVRNAGWPRGGSERPPDRAAVGRDGSEVVGAGRVWVRTVSQHSQMSRES